jgi:hypothetical protein
MGSHSHYCQYFLTALELLMALKLFFCATYNVMYRGSVLEGCKGGFTHDMPRPCRAVPLWV